MFLVLDKTIVNMNQVATIERGNKDDEGKFVVLIRTTAIYEWQMHQPNVGPGFSPVEIKFSTTEKTWDALIKAIKMKESVFILK